MSGQKCPAVRSTSASTSRGSVGDPTQKKAKRQVSVATFEKWQRNFDREQQTLAWLRCDVDQKDRGLVALLWCSACRQLKCNICSMKTTLRHG